MEYINISSPSAFYNVEKILEISQGQGNHRNYKVQWAPSWVNEIHLMGCDALIKQFLYQKGQDGTDGSQNTSEEVKQEGGACCNDENEIESASDEIRVLSEEPSEDIDDSTTDANITQPTMVGTNMMHDTIKIEEEECFMASNEIESAANHEIFDDEMVDDNDETTSNTKKHKGNSSTNNHFNSSKENSQLHSTTTSTGSDPRKHNLNFTYVNYTGNDTDNVNKISLSKQTKHTNRTSTNVKNHTNISHKNKKNSLNQIVGHNSTKTTNETDFSTYSGNSLQVKDNVIQNIDCNDSSNNIPTFLQHPKHKLTEKSDKGKHRGHNEWIDTNTYKNTSAYTNYPNSPLSNGTEQVSDDMNRNLTDNVLGNNRFETPIVNQHEEQSNDTGSSIILAHEPFNSSHIKVSPSHNMNDSPCLVQDDMNSASIDFPDVYVVTPDDTIHISDSTSLSMLPEVASNRTKKGSMNSNNSIIVTVQDVPAFSTSSEIENPKETICSCNYCKQGTEVQILYCRFCNKQFRCSTLLKQHVQTHTEGVPFQCQYCMRKFNYVCNLKTHIRRVHSWEKPYKCPSCTKRFSTSGDLKTHLRVHDEARPFKCSHCLKQFKHNSTMQQHLRRCNSKK